MRSIQGMLFIVIGVLAMKFNHVVSGSPGGPATLEGLPPMQDWMWLVMFAAAQILGFYCIFSGGIARALRGEDRYSLATFSSVIAFLAMVLTLKWSYHVAGQNGMEWQGFYPGENAMEVVCAATSILCAYFFLRGEIDFYRQRGHAADTEKHSEAEKVSGEESR